MAVREEAKMEIKKLPLFFLVCKNNNKTVKHVINELLQELARDLYCFIFHLKGKRELAES